MADFRTNLKTLLFPRWLSHFLRNSYGALLLTLTFISMQLIVPLIHLPEKIVPYLDHASQVGLILSLAWLVYRGLQAGREILNQIYDISTANNFRKRGLRTQIGFIYRLCVVVIVVVTISAVLMTFEGARQIGTSLIASAGIASVVLGFAAQRSLGNLIAGFQIAFTQPLRIDDVVIVEKEWGKIEEITLTYVVVQLWDLRRMILPITYFVEKPFENWTRKTSDILGSVFLYVDYSFPVEVLRTKLNEVIHESPLWDKKTVVLQVTDINAKCMEIRILASARNAPDAFDLRCFLRERLIGFIQKNYAACLPVYRQEWLGGNVGMAEKSEASYLAGRGFPG